VLNMREELCGLCRIVRLARLAMFSAEAVRPFQPEEFLCRAPPDERLNRHRIT
jgi:hypothetical protein